MGKTKIILIILLSSLFTAQAMAQQAELTWTYNRGLQEDGFIIERRPGPLAGTAPWVEIAKTAAGVLTYTDKTVVSGEYCYRVGAYNKTTTAWSVMTAKSCGLAVVLELSIPVVTLKMSQAHSGLEVSWAWEAPAKPASKDWVGLFVASAPNKDYLDGWQYTEGKAKGTFKTKPSKKGEYDVRYLLNDGFDLSSRSWKFAVE